MRPKTIASGTLDTYSNGVSIEFHVTVYHHHWDTTMSQGLSRKAFTAIWESSASLAEVEQRTGIKASIAAARAALYRREGIDLKTFPPGRKDEDSIDELNKLIEDMGGLPASAVTVPTVRLEGEKPTEVVERERKVAESLRRVLDNECGVEPGDKPE